MASTHTPTESEAHHPIKPERSHWFKSGVHSDNIDRVPSAQVSDQPFLPKFYRKYANPSPVAFMALANGLFIISVIALRADGLQSLSVSVSMALGYCCITELIAGIWSFPTGNTYGASLYLSLSGLFFSLVVLLSPWSDVSTSYTDTLEFSHAAGMFFFTWFITLTLFTIAAHRASGGLVFCLSMVDLFLLFIGLSYYHPTNTHLITAGGAFGIIAAFTAYYAAFASLLTTESSLFRLPVLGDLSPKERVVEGTQA